jgi:hypothetical protein
LARSQRRSLRLSTVIWDGLFTGMPLNHASQVYDGV